MTKSAKIFISFLTLYALFLIPATFLILQQGNSLSKTEHVVVKEIPNADVVAGIVDQLKGNSKSYLNNVWTTLATIVGALGMVLGSARFQEILRTGRSTVRMVQAVLVSLYVLHIGAYYLYLEDNIGLFNKLKFIIEPMDYYYTGYLIGSTTVILNLIFDTVLFILLACIVHFIGRQDELSE